LQIKPEPESLGKGERRQITTVFSDLSGYTSLNERLDPEEVEVIMSRIKKEAAGIVERLEGIVNQYVGDEVLALFGVPFAHEDDPVRAVRAALDIHRMVRRISLEVEARTRTELRMHTGISTGLIVTQMQDTREGSYGITGDTVNIGARLASHAETDQILVDPATYQLVAPYFETKALKPVTVAGKSKSLIPHLVTGQSAVQTRFEASRLRGFTSFTGREHELTTLYSCLENMFSRKGQFVTVAGEAGLGKSRLIYEFRHSLNRTEITVLQGRCQSYGTSIPYFPHINALRRGLNLRDDDTPSELHQKTVSNILGIDTSLEQYLPILLHLLSIPSTEYPLSKNLHDQELARAILEALAAVYILNTKNHPVVLIFEDWHWADEASDVALKYMHSLIASYPMMILVIFRPDYPANWGNWSHHTHIVLDAFDHFNCENIIKSVWDADHLPEGIVPLIHERTGGNPFFVEEISNALVEEDTVRLNDRRAVLNKPLEKVSIPNTVQAVIRARLDRLDDYTHESLRLASVIGREFTRRVLEKISTSREQLAQALERLKALELIQQTKLVPEAEYMFKHVITQEVTYETLLKQKRKDLHRLVGQAIGELYRDRLEEFYETLAFHFRRGQDWQRAYQYNREAGLKAQSFSAYIEAQNFLEVALEALQTLPRTTENLEREIDPRLKRV
ncbi:MAG: AAA family ATPase, partial [Desulfobacterales bacterium]